MSKAKSVAEVPAESLTKTADVATAYDSKGRLIAVKRLNALQFYRLTKAMGASSSNASAMDLATIASSVTKIDAENIAMPSTESDVEFLIQQLDFEGLTAAGEALKSLAEMLETQTEGVKEASKN